LFKFFQIIIAKKILKKSRLSLIAAIGWFIISIVLLTLPGTAFPQENWFDKIWLDKWIHIGMFGLLAALWCIVLHFLKNSTPEKLKTVFITTGIACLAYGIVMEFVQKFFIPYRSFDVGDIIADAVGSAAGVIYSIRRYIKK
jgi:hypothetical protein